jgi:hypothetical protein
MALATAGAAYDPRPSPRAAVELRIVKLAGHGIESTMRSGRRQDGQREQPVDGRKPRCSSCQASLRADLAKASPPHCAIAF